MPGARNGKLQHLKDRSINAYRLLRGGRFRVFWEMLRMEVEFQFGIVRERILRSSADISVLDSGYIDKHKLRPPSYQPTILKPAAPVAMQADPALVKGELTSILSSLNVGKRC